MYLLYSTNIFPWVYESSFQSVLSHFEDSGSSCVCKGYKKKNANKKQRDISIKESALTLSTLMCDNIAPHVQLFFAQRSKVVYETKWYSCTL